MDSQYRSRDIIFALENNECIDREAECKESNCHIESYKNMCNVTIRLKGLLPSDNLKEKEKWYSMRLIQILGQKKREEQLGVVKADRQGEVNIVKKINMLRFANKQNSIWDYNYILLDVCDNGGERETVLRGIISQEKRKENLLNYCRKYVNLASEEGELNPFDYDETNAKWYRCKEAKETPEELERVLEKGKKYSHFLIGRNKSNFFIAVPGRFISKEQPYFVSNYTPLWQPLRGAEYLFNSPEKMDEEIREYVYGYWIGKISNATGEFVEY